MKTSSRTGRLMLVGTDIFTAFFMMSYSAFSELFFFCKKKRKNEKKPTNNFRGQGMGKSIRFLKSLHGRSSHCRPQYSGIRPFRLGTMLSLLCRLTWSGRVAHKIKRKEVNTRRSRNLEYIVCARVYLLCHSDRAAAEFCVLVPLCNAPHWTRHTLTLGWIRIRASSVRLECRGGGFLVVQRGGSSGAFTGRSEGDGAAAGFQANKKWWSRESQREHGQTAASGRPTGRCPCEGKAAQSPAWNESQKNLLGFNFLGR